MDCIKSNLINGGGVIHGFGLAGHTLEGYLKHYSLSDAKHFTTDQMHSDNIVLLTNHLTILPSHKLKADAFITNEPNVVCFVRTADCVPILFYDPQRKVVSAVHAGWRGTAKNIAAKTVEKMVKEFGSKREDIIAAIGPAIGGKCYEVGEEVVNAFEIPPFVKGGEGGLGKHYIDLPAINHKSLINAGLKNIDLIPICNHCDKRFASYRRDNSEKFRQFNFICLLK